MCLRACYCSISLLSSFTKNISSNRKPWNFHTGIPDLSLYRCTSSERDCSSSKLDTNSRYIMLRKRPFYVSNELVWNMKPVMWLPIENMCFSNTCVTDQNNWKKVVNRGWREEIVLLQRWTLSSCIVDGILTGFLKISLERTFLKK